MVDASVVGQDVRAPIDGVVGGRVFHNVDAEGGETNSLLNADNNVVDEET